MSLHALVLAAGAARRFGAAKQLVSLGGQPLLVRTIERASAVAGEDLVVVLGARAEQIEPVLAGCPGRRVVNPVWEEGIASSLRAGIAALPEDCMAVLVMLADQAAVSVEDLRELVAAWKADPARITAAQYGAPPRPGVPAIFPRAWFAGLSQLTGDTGARALLARHPESVQAVPLPSAALDIDTPADAARYEAAGAPDPTREGAAVTSGGGGSSPEEASTR